LTYGSRTVASSTPVSISAFPTEAPGQPHEVLVAVRGGAVRVMMKAQEIEDEEYEQVLQRVAAVDVAKKAGMVCTRVPLRSRPGRRRTRVREVAATTADWILARSNDRRLTTSSGRDWVKNGDAWLVTRLTAGMPPPQPATRQLRVVLTVPGRGRPAGRTRARTPPA
jgi:hypothetical protein